MARFARGTGITPGCEHLACQLALSVLDPACGAGVFLVAAARLLALVMQARVYGARAACWPAVGGARPAG
jgi:hypothetical protein